MSCILKDPTASEPDIIAPALKAQLRKLFLARPHAHVNGRPLRGGGSDSLAAWKEWGFENKWGLLLISSLVVFLWYRWKYCREEDKPAIYATDFKADPHYFLPSVAQPMGYGVPAMQSMGWRGNGMPMTTSIPNQMQMAMPQMGMAAEPMAANQVFM
jgi:hypothetical protein